MSFNSNLRSFTTMLVVIIFSGLNVGCHHIIEKQNKILKGARDAYTQAKAHPHATELKELFKAKQILEKAEKAEDEEAEDFIEMRHLAYLAKRQAEIAFTIAERYRIEEKIARLKKTLR
ncbi:DUF4398 domain-containing protein [Candidatus Parabeggiatoa sp. HSG14]|uniref:DUF4398 domain-containing protein n=1 Tax=Candidatus Parabeggiatoa sp. HSG14 TaxID=3055593 RepID=UPI0025A76E18|nr:DUF4398 domain-containing protein [Thiotrichales bacterium HSG14]